MRIPLIESPYLGAVRSSVSAYVMIGSIKFPTTFILDTGSPYTIISEQDLQRTRIPFQSYKTFTRAKVVIDIDLKDFGECELTFLDVEGNPIVLKHNLYGGVFVNRNIRISSVFPSFLGKDFIDKYNLSISKKDDKGIRYLE